MSSWARQSASRALGLAAGLLALPGLLSGEEEARRAYPSFQGFTGLLNTPNALVTPEGSSDLLYSNQTEYPYRRQVPWTDNYILSFGLLPYAEGGIRLLNQRSSLRDFSPNVKIQLPFLPDNFPRVAVGSQDFAGAAVNLRTNYGVATQDLGPLRLSLGYGTGPDRMKGVFGGAELFVTPWLQVLGENDRTARNAGLRLSTPPGWLPDAMSLGALFKVGSHPQGQRGDLAVFLKVPLGHPSRRLHGKDLPRSQVAPAQAAPSPRDPGRDLPPAEPRLSGLAKTLTGLGFERVRVGTEGRTLVIQYENHRYNHNQLDGLGVLLGTALNASPDDLASFRVAVYRQGLRVVEVSGPAAPFRDLFNHAEEPSPAELAHLAEVLQVVASASFRELPGVAWLEPAPARPGLRSELLLYPGLDKTLGTELGVLDYRLSVMADWKVQLWPGGGFNARWDQPVAWSDDFRKGGVFETKGNGGRLDRVMVMQAVPLLPSVMTQFSVGQYLYRSHGWMNETVWVPGSGQHQFQVTGGQFRASDDQITRMLLGTYRLYLPRWDSLLEATTGSFYNRDRGYRVDLKRFFGDTALSVFYARTREQILGLALTVPLTPRRDLRPAAVQVRGWEHWPVGLYSVIRNSDRANPLTPGLAQFPDTPFSLKQATYDDGRLNASYMKEHVARLREAYLRWRP